MFPFGCSDGECLAVGVVREHYMVMRVLSIGYKHRHSSWVR